MEIIGQIISSLGIVAAAILAVRGYNWQKSSELEKSLIELRRSAYRKFLEQLHNMTSGSAESQVSYNSTVAELAVVATDDVMFAIGEFNQYMRVTRSDQRRPDIYKKLIAKIAIRMRQDCFSKSNLDIDTISKLLPYE